MADVYKYIVIMVGMTILLTLAGITTGSGLILEKLGVNILDNPEDIKLSGFFVTILSVLNLTALAGIIIGTIVTRDPAQGLMIGYTTLLLNYVADIIIIITYTNATYGAGIYSWVNYLVILIMLPIGIGYSHAVISWWFGR